MGLDTSHDCWHGPYSAFMRWRCQLNHRIRGKGTHREDLEQAWAEGYYKDQSQPINVLMNHSDCEGSIVAAMCGPLADALQAMVDKHEPRADYDGWVPPTQRFIAGLRRAAAAGEDVVFS